MINSQEIDGFETEYIILHYRLNCQGEKYPLDDVLDDLIAREPYLEEINRTYKGFNHKKNKKEYPVCVNSFINFTLPDDFETGMNPTTDLVGLTLTYEFDDLNQLDLFTLGINPDRLKMLAETAYLSLQSFESIVPILRISYQNNSSIHQISYDTRRFLMDTYDTYFRQN